ncbi:MAG: HAD family hydrolase, partial [Christensenellales bacterium]
MEYGFIIYDWNGTLLDDTAMCHDMLNELLDSHGLPAVSMEKYRQIFTFPIKKYYERAGFDF